MARKFAEPERIDNYEEISTDTHWSFLFHLQEALLLALRERGTLTPMQHRHAEEKLRQQRRDRTKQKQEEP